MVVPLCYKIHVPRSLRGTTPPPGWRRATDHVCMRTCRNRREVSQFAVTTRSPVFFGLQATDTRRGASQTPRRIHNISRRKAWGELESGRYTANGSSGPERSNSRTSLKCAPDQPLFRLTTSFQGKTSGANQMKPILALNGSQALGSELLEDKLHICPRQSSFLSHPLQIVGKLCIPGGKLKR